MSMWQENVSGNDQDRMRKLNETKEKLRQPMSDKGAVKESHD